MSNQDNEAVLRTIPTALVTGSSRGLGRGTALELAKAGFSVAVHYSGNEAAVRETASLCEASKVDLGQIFPFF